MTFTIMENYLGTKYGNSLQKFHDQKNEYVSQYIGLKRAVRIKKLTNFNFHC